jgi:uncharacterized protein
MAGREEAVMHADIAKKRPELIALCRRYDVARLEVFGSAAREGDFDPDRSDVDFLVEFSPGTDLPPLEQFFGLADALADVLGRRVDLVEPSAIQNPYIRAAVNRSRDLVYES